MRAIPEFDKVYIYIPGIFLTYVEFGMALETLANYARGYSWYTMR